jgi:hypothetical protein
VNAHVIDGGTGPIAAVAVFFRRSPAIASRFTAWLTARRTRTSLNGFFSVLRVTHQMCGPGCS